MGSPLMIPEHLWASAFLVFGFKSEAPNVHLKAIDMVLFIKKKGIPWLCGLYDVLEVQFGPGAVEGMHKCVGGG
ncbi:hypothetical protein CASFOL_018743 [Castilleja foliolosa]|uniref:Uncharacterized protein n=1 Tax=Castilleja foliolosa TaxID=1961234 RepID=A0ABD3D5K8_9LAMI